MSPGPSLLDWGSGRPSGTECGNRGYPSRGSRWATRTRLVRVALAHQLVEVPARPGRELSQPDVVHNEQGRRAATEERARGPVAERGRGDLRVVTSRQRVASQGTRVSMSSMSPTRPGHGAGGSAPRQPRARARYDLVHKSPRFPRWCAEGLLEAATLTRRVTRPCHRRLSTRRLRYRLAPEVAVSARKHAMLARPKHEGARGPVQLGSSSRSTSATTIV